LNKQYVKIIDIQETQDVSFCVNWAFPKAWARNLTSDLFGDLGTVGFLGEDLWSFVNGYIAIVPYTGLQSPNDSAITVNVYVSSDNMAFNQMVDTRMPLLLAVAESGEMDEKSSSAVPVSCFDLNESSASMLRISEEHFGERPVSFRALLKRFCGYTQMEDMLTATGGGGITGDTYMVLFQAPIYPPPFPSYHHDPAIFTTPNLFGYLRYAYLGMRGGIKHRLGVFYPWQTGQLNRTKIHLVAPASSSLAQNALSYEYQQLQSKMIGTVEYIPATNGGVEFETPLYTNNLFGISFNDDPFPDSCSLIDPVLTRDFLAAMPYSDSQFETNLSIVHDIAAAEDFSFWRFQGAPPYLYPT